jgi:hypothetical protein
MSAMTADTVLDRLEEATRAAIALARQLAAARTGDDDEWLRMPPPRGGRCPISKWSRTKLYALSKDGHLRTKSVQGARYYAGADVRRLLAG